jgi:hypothetical protein
LELEMRLPLDKLQWRRSTTPSGKQITETEVYTNLKKRPARSEFRELNIGGNGQTDNYGAPGNSKTGAHHMISAAEAMKRGLSADLVIAQVSAHAHTIPDKEFKVVKLAEYCRYHRSDRPRSAGLPCSGRPRPAAPTADTSSR